MQFHEYTSFRNLMVRQGDDETRDFAVRVSSQDFRRSVIERDVEKFGNDNTEGTEAFNRCSLALCEEVWVALDRPYYNVWPIATALAPSVKLNLPFSQVQLPFHAILLRFGRGHEPHQLRTAMLFWPKGFKTIQAFCHFADGEDNLLTVQHAYEPDDNVEEWLQNLISRRPQVAAYHYDAGLLIVRLVVFIGLLSRDDFVTPIVLAKDRTKYNSTDEAEVKHWLEERAARRAGRGFDVGKKLQLEKDKSPHWRNPHLCLFWTGEGRSKPIIQMRSGAIVQSVSIAEVPTGYLGPEGNEDDAVDPKKKQRESMSKRRRFAILQRDGFCCQLCGVTSANGVTLHVDHRVPLAKGGSNADDNLWTLCDHCNLGKSDSEIIEPARSSSNDIRRESS